MSAPTMAVSPRPLSSLAVPLTVSSLPPLVSGDFFGLGDDNEYCTYLHYRRSPDEKDIPWASHQEGMPTNGYEGFTYPSVGMGVAQYARRWPRYHHRLRGQLARFLAAPIAQRHQLNDNHTLILITFDETEMYIINHQIHVALLEGAVPDTLPGTVDSTYCAHYFPFPPLRQTGFSVRSAAATQTSKTLSNIFSFVANATNYTNLDISGTDIPLTNLTGNIPACSKRNSTCASRRRTRPPSARAAVPSSSVPGVDTNLTAANAPAAVNLTAKNETVLWSGPRVAATKSNSTTSGKKSGALGLGRYCQRQSAWRRFFWPDPDEDFCFFADVWSGCKEGLGFLTYQHEL
ncbi:hypothetical protein EI94DRAFT_1787594 [Lactarius quietus]|nr:hypothetical protein EI94DRAFT_1787594 [Lactarius quietus]